MLNKQWLFLWILSLGASLMAHAGDLYRYMDDNGTVVLDGHVPPEFVHKGYEVVNPYGRVVETIAPVLTEEQLKNLDGEAERRAMAAIQAQQDETLLKLYSHPDDIRNALNRKISQIESLNQFARIVITRLNKQKAEEQDKAASLERAGKPIPDDLVVMIQKFETEIVEENNKIERNEEDKEKVRALFFEDEDRLRELLGYPARDEDGTADHSSTSESNTSS